jgi:hypothetical protein
MRDGDGLTLFLSLSKGGPQIPQAEQREQLRRETKNTVLYSNYYK